MERKKGSARDLVERVKSGKLAPHRAYEELRERGLVEHERWEVIFYIAYFVLWLLPGLAKHFGVSFLSFCEELPAYRFPMTIIYISIALITVLSQWNITLSRWDLFAVLSVAFIFLYLGNWLRCSKGILKL